LTNALLIFTYLSTMPKIHSFVSIFLWIQSVRNFPAHPAVVDKQYDRISALVSHPQYTNYHQTRQVRASPWQSQIIRNSGGWLCSTVNGTHRNLNDESVVEGKRTE
jgi:hypothetical protein